jgi:hypothetical protein
MSSVASIEYVTLGSDYHLGVSSPAIDAAGSSTMVEDIDGGLRQDGNPDLGADEYGAMAYLLSVKVTATGAASGTVTSDEPGLDCGSDCKELFQEGTIVTLTAVPANSNSIFSGWQGDADCDDGVVTMDADLSCTASFLDTSIFSDDFETGDTSQWSSTVG